MRALQLGSILLVAVLAVGCADDRGGPPTVTDDAELWSYTDLAHIRPTFLGATTSQREPPRGYDEKGEEIWERYRVAAVALEEVESEYDGEAALADLVDVARELFTYTYTTGLAEEMIAGVVETNPATVVEQDVVLFEDGRPEAVRELDRELRAGGCAGIERSYYPWLGQTTIDEVAGRASVFARYALDRAAAAGCEWAISELIEQGLGISGLDE